MKRPSSATLFALLAVFCLCGCAEDKKAAAPPPPPEVMVAEVVQKDIPVYREWVASMDGIVNGTSITYDLFLADGSKWPGQGTFSFADRQVDLGTGTIRVAILFPNPDNTLRPGQFAKVRALMGTEKNALLVPQRAVGELQGNYQVAVVGGDNTVNIRNVKVGERSDGYWWSKPRQVCPPNR